MIQLLYNKVQLHGYFAITTSLKHKCEPGFKAIISKDLRLSSRVVHSHSIEMVCVIKRCTL